MAAQPRRALVVDDDAALRLMLRASLEREGLAVVEAANGADALAKFDQFSPDIVLLDVVMPELDGFATCRELRSRGPRPAHPHPDADRAGRRRIRRRRLRGGRHRLPAETGQLVDVRPPHPLHPSHQHGGERAGGQPGAAREVAERGAARKLGVGSRQRPSLPVGRDPLHRGHPAGGLSHDARRAARARASRRPGPVARRRGAVAGCRGARDDRIPPAAPRRHVPVRPLPGGGRARRLGLARAGARHRAGRDRPQAGRGEDPAPRLLRHRHRAAQPRLAAGAPRHDDRAGAATRGDDGGDVHGPRPVQAHQRHAGARRGRRDAERGRRAHRALRAPRRRRRPGGRRRLERQRRPAGRRRILHPPRHDAPHRGCRDGGDPAARGLPRAVHARGLRGLRERQHRDRRLSGRRRATARACSRPPTRRCTTRRTRVGTPSGSTAPP